LRYNGTLILVSHDRDFLQGLTDKVFEFSGGNIKEYIGDIQYYIDKRNLESLKSLETKQLKTNSISKSDNKNNKLSWEEQKQKDSDRRKLERQIENQENKIHELEQSIKQLENKLSYTEQYKQEIASGELYKQYQKHQTSLEEAVNEWERLLGMVSE
jgi:ATP-binding cassette subfamily F protein 3